MSASFSSRSIFILINVLCLLHLVWSQTIQEKEKKVLDDIMRNYDKRIRPTGANGTLVNAPTTVSVNMYVISLDRVDDIKMEYDIQLYFRQFWNDQRFKFSDMGGSLRFLVLDDVSKIWTPDLFFLNEKQSRLHNMVKTNYFVRIFPNGNIMFSQRVSLTMGCPMSLGWYPFDRQICNMRIESYGWTTAGMKLMWKDAQPVDVAEHVNLPLHSLDHVNVSTCHVSLSTGDYNCLEMSLHLSRNFMYHFVRMFNPSIMFVMLSWVAFWLDHKDISARIVVGVTALLAMTLICLDFEDAIASVSYIRSIDVWTGVCFTFLFCAILETASVSYKYREEAKRRPNSGEEDGGESVALNPLATNKGPNPEAGNFIQVCLAKIPAGPKKLDLISRIAFPTVFLVFVILYAIVNFAQ